MSNVTQELWQVYFVNDNEGWIAGGYPGMQGVVLHTTTGGVTDIYENDKDIVKSFLLEQNYPNPFNPTTVISYQLPEGKDVTLKVFDILCNEIATLVDEYKPAGKYEVEFQSAVDNRQLASGIYFYQLRTDNYIAIKKMILLK